MVGEPPPTPETIEVPRGRERLGASVEEIPFGWDDEHPVVAIDVPAFTMDRYDVTNEDFLEFVESGGYRDERWWGRDAFDWLRAERIEHPCFWVVVTANGGGAECSKRSSYRRHGRST